MEPYLDLMYPTPAIGSIATNNQTNCEDSAVSTSSAANVAKACTRPLPGTLPESSSNLSAATRGLLLRLLDRDPRLRMRNLRQLQQSAFFMGFNFEHVKAKKVSPKSVLEKHFVNDAPNLTAEIQAASQAFPAFDQPIFV